MIVVNEKEWIGAWRKPELEGIQDEWIVVEMTSENHTGLWEVQDYEVVATKRDSSIYVAILP